MATKTVKPKNTAASVDTEKKKLPAIDFNSTFFLKKEERLPAWRLINAEGKILGRLATEITEILRGKDVPTFTPHTDSGDYVVVINAEKIKLTADKMNTKIYTSYSGWIGGLKELTAKQVMEKDPARLIEYAVEGMLPKNRLSRQIIKKLKVYAGDQHPHAAQISGSAK
jgi:large subunit ribosomal protein L13